MCFLSMTVYIGADHAGFRLKEELKQYLTQRGVNVVDCGNEVFEKKDDYPDFAAAVARKTVRNRARGILICNNGVGMCIAANKVRGSRAVVSMTPGLARSARRDDDTNILCLGQGFVTTAQAKRIVRAFLEGSYQSIPRRNRRLKKVQRIERGTL